MALPHLTFYCELEPQILEQLLNDDTVADLTALDAGVSLGILDLTPERAAAVSRLNQAGIPVVAWLLLPKEKGYWFNLYNATHAAERYSEFKRWAQEHSLVFEAIGMDIEPDIRELASLTQGRWRMVPELLGRVLNYKVQRQARKDYQALIAKMKADGFSVESYQFPIIADERRVGTTLLQRVLGLVDISVDREVWMLYSNFLRPNGAGLIASYAPEAQSIGLGSTGGGVDVEFGNFPPLSWEEFARDLRLAWYWCDDLYIFSLEGCVQQGFLSKMRTFTWDFPILMPESSRVRVDAWRQMLRSSMWFFTNTKKLLLGGLAVFLIWKVLKRLFGRK
jgi:hypothetical protein